MLLHLFTDLEKEEFEQLYTGSVRGYPNNTIGKFTKGTIGSLVPLVENDYITNGTIGRSLDDIGQSTIGIIRKTLNACIVIQKTNMVSNIHYLRHFLWQFIK